MPPSQPYKHLFGSFRSAEDRLFFCEASDVRETGPSSSAGNGEETALEKIEGIMYSTAWAIVLQCRPEWLTEEKVLRVETEFPLAVTSLTAIGKVHQGTWSK